LEETVRCPVKMLKKSINWLEKHYIITLIITIIIAVFIFYISSQSFEKGSGPKFPLKSYVYHFSIFFLLAFFLAMSIKSKMKRSIFIFIAVLFAIAYGAFDEIHQLFVPNRCCDINDFLTDSAGVLLAGIFYAIKR
jgi:uncharacterized membrane protein YoaK (UPF0700 family)